MGLMSAPHPIPSQAGVSSGVLNSYIKQPNMMKPLPPLPHPAATPTADPSPLTVIWFVEINFSLALRVD